MILTTLIFSVVLAFLTIIGLFFVTKEIKAQNINFLNPNFKELKVIIGNNNKDGSYMTYSYEFND